MNNNTNPKNNHTLPKSVIWNQKYFKFLIISNLIFMPSLIIFVISGPLLLSGNGGYLALAMLIISTFSVMISCPILTVSTIYTFFKTIKRKDFLSHAHNIFSRYILAASLVSIIYLFLVYRIFNLYNYLETNSLEMINTIPFILINTAGFIHLTILNNKYKNQQQNSSQ